MNITPEQLVEIEGMARAFFTPEEIAIVLGVDYDTNQEYFSKENGGDIYKAYMRGRLKRKLELNNLIIQQAIAGSQPAQQECNKLSEDQIASE